MNNSESPEHHINHKQQASEALSQLKYTVTNWPKVIKHRFNQIELQVVSAFASVLGQLAESRRRIFADLDSFQLQCLQSVDATNNAWFELHQFVVEHQIDAKMIDHYLATVTYNQQALQEINEFCSQLKLKEREFNNLIQLNRKPSFQLTFKEDKCLQQGLLSFTAASNDSVRFERLEDCVMSKEDTEVAFQFDFDDELFDENSKRQKLR